MPLRILRFVPYYVNDIVLRPEEVDINARMFLLSICTGSTYYTTRESKILSPESSLDERNRSRKTSRRARKQTMKLKKFLVWDATDETGVILDSSHLNSSYGPRRQLLQIDVCPRSHQLNMTNSTTDIMYIQEASPGRATKLSATQNATVVNPSRQTKLNPGIWQITLREQGFLCYVPSEPKFSLRLASLNAAPPPTVEKRHMRSLEPSEKDRSGKKPNESLFNRQITLPRFSQDTQVLLHESTIITYTDLSVVTKGRFNGREVAIKKPLSPISRKITRSARKCFENECEILQSLDHDSIISFVGSDSITCTILTEYFPGITLSEYLSEVKPRGELTHEIAYSIFEKVAVPVKACHDEGIAHLDLKPRNFMVKRDLSDVKLIDFGFAKRFDNVEETKEDKAFAGGTPTGIPWEFLLFRERGMPSDVWALGVLMLECLNVKPRKMPDQHFIIGNVHKKGADREKCERYLSKILQLANQLSDEDVLVKGCFVRDPKARITAAQLVKKLKDRRSYIPQFCRPSLQYLQGSNSMKLSK